MKNKLERRKINGIIILIITAFSLISNSFSVKAYSDIIDEANHVRYG